MAVCCSCCCPRCRIPLRHMLLPQRTILSKMIGIGAIVAACSGCWKVWVCRLPEILRILLLIILVIIVEPLLISAKAVPPVTSILSVAASSASLLVRVPLLVKVLEVILRGRFGHGFGIGHCRHWLVVRYVPSGLLLHGLQSLLDRHLWIHWSGSLLLPNSTIINALIGRMRVHLEDVTPLPLAGTLNVHMTFLAAGDTPHIRSEDCTTPTLGRPANGRAARSSLSV